MLNQKLQFTVVDFKIRLDKFLAKSLSGVSRAAVQRAIEGGFVKVNHTKVVESKHLARKGDVVFFTEPPKQVSKVTPAPLVTLYNNHGLLVIDKPFGISAHPGAGVKGDSLVSALLYYFADIHTVGETHRPGIVHRLDKDTSGVMLIARSQEMYEYLKNAFADRKVKKQYIALVSGKLVNAHGIIDTPIGKSKTDFRKHSVKNVLESKQALTEYTVIEHFNLGVDNFTLIKVLLHTGRTHQIRVHFASLGHPVAGDRLYGFKKQDTSLFSRQFLHAWKIEVKLPNETWIEAESPLPHDLRQILKTLGSKQVNSL